MDKGIFNVKDQEGTKREGEEQIKQRITKHKKQISIKQVKQQLKIG